MATRRKPTTRAWGKTTRRTIRRFRPVFDAALDGDMQTARWLLARRLPGLYGRRVELEQQGEVRAKRDVRIRLVTATKGRKDPDD